MLGCSIDALDGGHTRHYEIDWNGHPFGYGDALKLWRNSADYREQFLDLLRDCPFRAYRWETPPVTIGTLSRRFEFVLIDDPQLARPADDATFADHYDKGDSLHGIVSFPNLGGDAMMVVPSPHGEPQAYAHIGAFVHHAPETQQHALWQVTAATMQSRIGDEPTWLSTAGDGVAWLHLRLDSYPKYYRFRPYTRYP